MRVVNAVAVSPPAATDGWVIAGTVFAGLAALTGVLLLAGWLWDHRRGRRAQALLVTASAFGLQPMPWLDATTTERLGVRYETVVTVLNDSAGWIRNVEVGSTITGIDLDLVQNPVERPVFPEINPGTQVRHNLSFWATQETLPTPSLELMLTFTDHEGQRWSREGQGPTSRPVRLRGRTG
jgi:hypothetical protein